MNKYWILIILLLLNSNSFAQLPVTNLITPISYFVNHEKQCKFLQNNLSKYSKASLVGPSGIGKTQLARTYVYANKDNYEIIWFFDCNIDLNEEFIKLAQQLNNVNKTDISTDANLAKKEVMSYLTTTNKWLLVFDNLKIGENKKIQEFIDWEHNGNVIFCSQDSEDLSNVIEISVFDRKHSFALAHNLLDNKNNNDIEFLIKAFKGYPLMIVQGVQLLNKIPGLNREEYQKKIYQSADKITININMAIEKLTPNAAKLLKKIALLNNQSFSKQLLAIITDNEDTLDNDIYQLSKFSLISNIDSNENNPIFEMHDIIANKIMEINGDKNNKIYLENIVHKLPKEHNNSTPSWNLWRYAKTIIENLEVLLQNSEKYNIDIYAILHLRCELSFIYVNSRNMIKAKEMVNWFKQKDESKEFKLWKMSEWQKYYYAKYLEAIGLYNMIWLSNYELAASYLTKALKILNTHNMNNDFVFFKSHLYSQMASIQIFIGDMEAAEENIRIMEELFKHNPQKTNEWWIYHLKACLFFDQGKYNEALEYNNKAIKLDNNHIITSCLSIEILNSLGKYQEAYNQAQQLYNICQSTHNKNNINFALIYTQIAKSEVGLGKLEQASEHINKAMDILAYNHKNLDRMIDPDLITIQIIQGDISFAQDNIKQAIESYKKAYIQCQGLYKVRAKNVAQVSELYSKGAKAACKAKDLYNYKFFGKPQVKEFGIHHPNTISMFEYCKQYDMDLWTKKN